jgi:hypothetical protein
VSLHHKLLLFNIDKSIVLLFNLGMEQAPEFFTYKCPHCATVRNAAEVAAELPDEVLRLAGGRRNAHRRQIRHAGPGRPTLARCPGCSQEMSSADLRDHRLPCVRDELQKAAGMTIQLTPKDPDPYPNFHINRINEGEVEFQKGSNHDIVTVDLRKIADITISPAERVAYIRVLGRIVWHADIKRWRFAPTGAVGRPPSPL